MFGLKKRELPEIQVGENPYLSAKEIWYEQYGQYIVSASRWRFVAFFTLIVATLSLTANIIQLRQEKIARYFVAMDELGKTVTEKIKTTGDTVPERIIQANIAQAIVDWRSVTVDMRLQKSMVDNLSAHVGGTAKGMLARWYEKNSPYKTAKDGKLVSVDIKNIPIKVSDKSYRVEWIEVVRSLQGEELARINYEAVATIELFPPQTEEMVLKNPGGVFIVNLDTNRVLTGEK